MTGSEALTATVRIGAAPADVFPYFIDPGLLIRWIGEWADLHPEPGGVFALNFSNTAVRGAYVEIDPPRRVVFTWGVPGKDSLPPGSTTVEVILTADGPDTVVELFHHGLPAAERDGHLEGWTAILARLVGLFNEPAPGPLPHRSKLTGSRSPVPDETSAVPSIPPASRSTRPFIRQPNRTIPSAPPVVFVGVLTSS